MEHREAFEVMSTDELHAAGLLSDEDMAALFEDADISVDVAA